MFWSKKNRHDSPTVELAPKPAAPHPFQVANLQGIGARARQEDSFASVNALDPQQYAANGMMFCVCDGMGGMKGGKLASETAVQSFRECFASLDFDGDISQQLREGMHAANKRVVEALNGNGGSTAVVCVIYREQLFFANAGDSFLYLLRGGKLMRLNVLHNMCHFKYLDTIRNGQLEPLACRAHAEAAALISFLGMAGYTISVDATVLPLPLQKGDVLLACSDGVGGVLSESELKEAMSASSVQEMCLNIEQRIEAKACPYQDNYTALMVGYN